MNYFSYFTEIEDTFIRRRGKHLLLSPIDWALIESWKEIGVPLHVALRGIERAFDSWEAKPRKRTVKSLLYCQEEVEAQYAEWIEAHVGWSASNRDGQIGAEEQAGEDGLPFPHSQVLDHLQRSRKKLLETAEERKNTREDDLCDTLTRAAVRLEELERDFALAKQPDAQRLEDSLTGLERLLSDSLRSFVEPEQHEAIRREVEGQLRPYQDHMEPAVYNQTRDNLLLKRLREQFNVPRLSLFYL